MATTGAEVPLFLDTNVLIYASVKEAPEHLGVRRFVERHLLNGAPLYINRQVLREYLAVLSRPQSHFQTISRETLLDWLSPLSGTGRYRTGDGGFMAVVYGNSLRRQAGV